MHRMIAGAKKALHRNKHESGSTQDEQEQPDQAPVIQNLWNLSISPTGPLGGYTCWDNTQCGLCSRFLDRWFILNMFTSKSLVLGNTSDLLKWSRASGRCALCNYLSLRFIMDVEEETGGEIPLDAIFIVRWTTRDTAIKSGRKDEVSSFEFEFSWGFPQGRTRPFSLNCFTNEGRLN